MLSFATPEPITATLITGGAVVLVAASERPDTVVRVEPVDEDSKSDVKVAERTKVDFADGELTVRTTKPGSVAITVELPVGSALVLRAAASDVHADGVFGVCELNVASGQVRLDRVAALRGSVSAGSVAIGHVRGPVTLEGGAADVRIGEAEGAVEYRGSNGSFDIDRAGGSVTAKAADCPIRIGRMTRGHADLANASGGIEIGIGEHTAAEVDADSTKGLVRNWLHGNPDGDHLTVHARTRLDDIVIHRAAA
ncbi:hypothetical protein [Kibdelosporangium phytohabitans]|uniref:Adhesin domain-containing protein n=1 Tax=Kibdelosporangium phytohabitans TaxID=860235 RepID=A0A0N9HTI0_9PSEU|nr:hypothetical protein [Kibdelosporangium phytohabitans]ALG08446.1 hypothetical protein AOZ06_17355 [Kibdelosporangium phytohabitans]MBE1470499.1 hypothetical protein [Kibdelosporangium phytohabitans]